MKKHKTLLELFNSKYLIPNNLEDCWLIKSKRPYGRMCYYKNNIRTYINCHQAAYKLFVGEIPDKAWVLHKCNNAFCCNPSHLYIGDRKQNEIDKVIAGSIKGEKHPKSVVTEKDVYNIRKMILDGYSNKEIMLKFNITENIFQKIKHKRTWNWLI